MCSLYLKLVALALGVLGAIMMAIQAFHPFKGEQFVRGQTYADITNSTPQVETEAFIVWQRKTFCLAVCGLIFLIISFSISVVELVGICDC